MQLTVIGSGDAFGSAGRLQTCFLLETERRRFLLDCGATAQIGLSRLALDANSIDTIVISHLHGDHFAGLVWVVLAAQYRLKRTAPLRVIGPPTVAERYEAAAEILFPGMTKVRRAFALTFIEITADRPYVDDDLAVTAFEVSHPSGAPSHALRLETGGRILAFSGDTEWVEALVNVAAGADLFITECCALDRPVKYHLNWRTIEQNLPRLTAKRILLTHMNDDMLAAAPGVASARILIAEDGLQFTV
jgi:ribonuclease BN (tRNA processing enzyme)